MMIRRRFVALLLAIPWFTRRIQAKAGGVAKYRPCNGDCCHASPLRRPHIVPGEIVFRDCTIDNDGVGTCTIGQVDGCSFCEFHSHTMQFDVNSGCRIMADHSLLSVLTKEELKKFSHACLMFPHLGGPYQLGEKNESICCYRNT